MDWQTIDTAPKSGGDFLAWSDQHGMRIVYYSIWIDCSDGEEHEGWRDTHALEDLPELTHWMPLPRSPQESAT